MQSANPSSYIVDKKFNNLVKYWLELYKIIGLLNSWLLFNSIAVNNSYIVPIPPGKNISASASLIKPSVLRDILSVIIKELIDISNKESKYNKELKKILKQYNSNIVNIKKFYNKKKYNLIYVDSFDELMDVHNKANYPISFRETKKNYESIFVIIDYDNAWIYRLVADKI